MRQMPGLVIAAVAVVIAVFISENFICSACFRRSFICFVLPPSADPSVNSLSQRIATRRSFPCSKHRQTQSPVSCGTARHPRFCALHRAGAVRCAISCSTSACVCSFIFHLHSVVVSTLFGAHEIAANGRSTTEEEWASDTKRNRKNGKVIEERGREAKAKSQADRNESECIENSG